MGAENILQPENIIDENALQDSSSATHRLLLTAVDGRYFRLSTG